MNESGTVWGPHYTGGPGQNAPVAPPVGGTGSDSDFIQATCHFCRYRIRFCVKFLYTKFNYITSSSCYNGHYFTGLVHAVVMYCSLAKARRLVCIARSWEFRFAMLTSVRAKRFTGSSGKTSLDLNVYQGKAAGPTEDSCAVTQSRCW